MDILKFEFVVGSPHISMDNGRIENALNAFGLLQ